MITADSEAPYLVIGNKESPPPSDPRRVNFHTISNITRVGLITCFRQNTGLPGTTLGMKKSKLTHKTPQ